VAHVRLQAATLERRDVLARVMRLPSESNNMETNNPVKRELPEHKKPLLKRLFMLKQTTRIKARSVATTATRPIVSRSLDLPTLAGIAAAQYFKPVGQNTPGSYPFATGPTQSRSPLATRPVCLSTWRT